MNPGGQAIRVTRRIHASAEAVFGAWLDPQVARRWLFATATQPLAEAAIDARVHGAFRLVDGRGSVHTGVYLELAPPQRLIFTLSVGTRVIVDVTPRPTGCALAVTHDNVPRGRLHDTRARWTGMLYGLSETLDRRKPRPLIPRSL